MFRFQVWSAAMTSRRLSSMHEPALPDSALPARWTTSRYLKLVDDGVLGPGDRVELVEGVLVPMAPQNVPHSAGVTRVDHILQRAVGRRGIVRVQLPFIAAPRSVPEPDAAVVAPPLERWDAEQPREAYLIVEVAESSLKFDRLTKRGVYAAAGIPEYWIVNVVNDCVEVRREPIPDERRYANVTIARRGQRLQLAALPGVRVRVSDLLPSRASVRRHVADQ